jgi:hypothetical protein
VSESDRLRRGDGNQERGNRPLSAVLAILSSRHLQYRREPTGFVQVGWRGYFLD